ncbi:hypothetical protein IV203_014589 [Nitzschia inconspicua]|uniref:Uncharacterized protein n=1 Tax=Nitzschia inconspicua TaxID=303405 RepID=A0A9K3PSH9_9STRA|nr:hypothetical protein IV203_014589 [Nitzschia inconspicua]
MEWSSKNNAGNAAINHINCAGCVDIFHLLQPNRADLGELRQSTLVCDRKNSRGPKGQTLPKRTSTSKATTLKDNCKVKLAFDADSISIFLVCGIGESQHEGHRPRNAVDMATRKRIVPAAATDFQKMSANHNIGPGKTAVMVELEFGLHLTRRQVAQMQQMAKLADYLTSTDEFSSYPICFYLDVRGFDAYSNMEGTNYGVKYCENRVLPNMSQAKATKVMINQDEDKFTQNRKKTSDAFHKKPLQARTNTSAHVLPTAESMLQQAMVASESYISYHCCEHKWWVLYSGHRNLPFGTNFESFTHHSINIQFWTAYSLYAVALDPSELNEDELNIRNKLVTARWKYLQAPTAPASMKSMVEGRFSVGSESCDKFKVMTSDQLLLHFEALMKNKLSILNYKIEHVENAVAIMEQHQGNAVGMTQEMHNCSALLAQEMRLLTRQCR